MQQYDHPYHPLHQDLFPPMNDPTTKVVHVSAISTHAVATWNLDPRDIFFELLDKEKQHPFDTRFKQGLRILLQQLNDSRRSGDIKHVAAPNLLNRPVRRMRSEEEENVIMI